MVTLSFVIPVYNEEKRIGKTLEALDKELIFDGVKLEKVYFVDDGSKDRTVKKIQNWIDRKAKKPVKANKTKTGVEYEIISYPDNRGKGYAVKQGMKASASDYTLFFDADMSTPIEELHKFVPLMKKGVDVIIGTRKNGHSTVIKHQPHYRELLGRGFTLLSNIILNTWVTDFTCGFKAFNKDAKEKVFEQAVIDRWSYDAEIVYIANKLGYEIKEVAVVWSNDAQSKVNLLNDIPTTLFDLLKIRFSSSYTFSPFASVKRITNNIVGTVSE